MIVNGWSNGVWKKALKNGVGVVAGVILTSMTDPVLPLYSRDWFKHVLIGATTIFIVTELGYIKNWAGNGNGNGGTAPKI